MKKTMKKMRGLVVLSMVVALVGAYVIAPSAQAAAITGQSMLLDDSRTSQAGVEYTFAGDYGTNSVQCIQVQFCDTSSGTCNLPSAMVTTTALEGSYTGWTGASWTFDATVNGTLEWTSAGDTGATTNSISATTITNSDTVGSYFARVNTYTDASCTTGEDDGFAAFAILDGVVVSADIAETLSVSVNAVNAATCTMTGGTEVDTTSNTVAFGEIATDTFNDACQRIDISTNSAAGYNVTIQETNELTSGGNFIDDGTCGASCTDSSAGAWGTATDSGFAYCMSNVSGVPATTADAAWGTNGCGAGTQNFKTIADASLTETPDTIMESGGVISGDSAYVGFRLSVAGDQAPGTYTNEIVYIATATY